MDYKIDPPLYFGRYWVSEVYLRSIQIFFKILKNRILNTSFEDMPNKYPMSTCIAESNTGCTDTT